VVLHGKSARLVKTTPERFGDGRDGFVANAELLPLAEQKTSNRNRIFARCDTF